MTESSTDDERDSSTTVVVGPTGDILGVYRKIHLYDAFGLRESTKLKPGSRTTPLTFDLGGLRFGVMTCYDLRFPEMARTLVDAGATALLTPAAWMAGPSKQEHWSTLLRARAIENTCYVVGVAQTGPICVGHSVAIDPMGTVVSGLAESPGSALATLSADRVTAVRATNPSLVNRRFRVVPAD